jgi:hypothetical protein
MSKFLKSKKINININNIRFILLGKTISAKGYVMVKIKSEYYDIAPSKTDTQIRRSMFIKKSQSFFVYKSFSQIGLWRLAAEQNAREFYKGFDYAQSTLIHLDLQNFINGQIEFLEHIDALYENEPDHELASYDKLVDSIDQVDRIVRMAPFSEFADTTSCGSILKTERSASRILASNSKFVRASNFDKIISNATLLEFGNRIKEKYSIKPQDRTYIYGIPDFFVTSNKKSEGSAEYGVTAKNVEIYKTTFEPQTESPPIDLYYAEATLLNKVQIEMLELTQEILRETNSTTVFGDEKGKKQFAESFNKLKDNAAVMQFIRGYQEYFSPRAPKETRFCGPDKSHFMPFLLTTADSSCTPFGLYSKYIPAGIYICKLFDYLEQCTLIERDECRVNGALYAYIGDRYKNVFPFDEIEKTIKTTHNRTCRARRIETGPGQGWASSKRTHRGGKRTRKQLRRR